MTTCELIWQLVKSWFRHGNLPVILYDGCCYYNAVQLLWKQEGGTITDAKFKTTAVLIDFED